MADAVSVVGPSAAGLAFAADVAVNAFARAFCFDADAFDAFGFDADAFGFATVFAGTVIEGSASSFQLLIQRQSDLSLTPSAFAAFVTEPWFLSVRRSSASASWAYLPPSA